jgi:hypothetical protein
LRDGRIVLAAAGKKLAQQAFYLRRLDLV